MNVDYFPFANQTTSISPIWYYATGAFSLLCLLCGILSNGLVIFVFIRNTNLQRPRNYLLINLALTDLGLLLTNNTFHVIASFKKQWPFGQIGCNLYAFCGGMCGLTSIASMVAISLTRLSAVIHPLSSLKLTGHFTLKCIACSWIYGSIWLIPPLIDRNHFVLEGFGTSCTFNYISKSVWNRLYMLILIIGGFLIPLMIILVSYIFILIKVSERSRHFMYQNAHDQIHKLQLRSLNIKKYFYSINSSIGSIRDEHDNSQVIQNLRRTEIRVTRTALLVCGIYCAAWGPYALMAILSQFGFNSLINPYTTAMLGLFTKTAACINPLIYALSSSAFRRYIYAYIHFLHTRRDISHFLGTPNCESN